MSDLRCDLAANSDPLSKAALTVYRFGRWTLRQKKPVKIPGTIVYKVANTVISRMLLGIDLPREATVGPGLRLFHGGRGVAIHRAAVIGGDCTIYQNVAIGNWNRDGEVPVLGDRVKVGVGAAILGPVRVGDGAAVGPHALVRDDVRPGERVFLCDSRRAA